MWRALSVLTAVGNTVVGLTLSRTAATSESEACDINNRAIEIYRANPYIRYQMDLIWLHHTLIEDLENNGRR